MPINIPCSACRTLLAVSESSLGKQVKCPKCQTSFVAAAPLADAPAAAIRASSPPVPPRAPTHAPPMAPPSGDWRDHQCVGCGCEFAYAFQRKASFWDGNSLPFGLDRVWDRLLHRDVNSIPCPQCGTYQPPMVGAMYQTFFGRMLVAEVLVFALLLTLGGTGNYEILSIILVCAAALACILLLARAFFDPNGSPGSKLEQARLLEMQGRIQRMPSLYDEPGARDAPASMRWRLGVVLLTLSIPLLFVPILMRLMLNAPENPRFTPSLLSPGDEARVRFTGHAVRSLGGKWRGEAHAIILNAEQLGLAFNRVEGVSHNDQWGDQISVERDQIGSIGTAWARLKMPPDAQLAGKTMQLQVNLDLEYPIDIGNNQFDVHRERVDMTDLVTLAAPGIGPLYRATWWVCGVLGVGAILFTTLNWRIQAGRLA